MANKYKVWQEKSKRWREANPEKVEEYKRSSRGKYAQLKRAAKRDERIFEITLEEYMEITEGAVCHYCHGMLSPMGYSLDRVDHLKGYTKDNVVACCGMKNGRRSRSCNFIKGRIEAAGFIYPRTVELLLELLCKENANVNKSNAAAA